MQAHILPTWIAHCIAVRQRLERVCTGYLLFLMVVTTKHSFAEAAHFSGLHKSQQFPLITCESYVTMAADSSLSVSTIRFRLLKRLARSELTGCLVESGLLSWLGIASPRR